MKNLVIPAVLVLTLSLAPVALAAGENPGSQLGPALSQQVNETQLDQCKGKMGDPADYSQVSKTVPNTLQATGDTINFSENVMGTLKGYNTHPPSDPAIGPSGGPIGPSGNIGPTWARGTDITVHNR
jgi:hypothetical protein